MSNPDDEDEWHLVLEKATPLHIGPFPDCARIREALRAIQRLQPEMLETLEHNGVVFDGPLGNDPSNWQHVAFSIYTQLCEAESIARAALDEEA